MDSHRIFGLLLTDFFAGSPFVVELEKDLSLKQQFLDVVIIRRGKGKFTEPLPDGFEDLTDHNLVTFKSHHEALDDWALKELTGHYVKYRKQQSVADEPLLPESAFRLYAVCSRFPHNLAQQVAWQPLRDGVYDCRRGTDVIRIVVAAQLSHRERNAMLLLFSVAEQQYRYGKEHYRQRASDTSSLINELLQEYRREGRAVPYTMEDWRRDFAKKYFKDLTPEDKQEAIQSMSPEERLAGLSPEDIEKALKKLKARPSTPARKKRKRQ